VPQKDKTKEPLAFVASWLVRGLGVEVLSASCPPQTVGIVANDLVNPPERASRNVDHWEPDNLSGRPTLLFKSVAESR
jgi:hypothetical protein